MANQNNLGAYANSDTSGKLVTPGEKPLFVNSSETSFIGRMAAGVRTVIFRILSGISNKSLSTGHVLNPFNEKHFPDNMREKKESIMPMFTKKGSEYFNPALITEDPNHMGRPNIKQLGNYFNYDEQTLINKLGDNVNPLHYNENIDYETASATDFMVGASEVLAEKMGPSFNQLCGIRDTLSSFVADGRLSAQELNAIENFKTPLANFKKEFEQWYLDYFGRFENRLKKLKKLARTSRQESIEIALQRLQLQLHDLRVLYSYISNLFNHVVNLVYDPTLLLNSEGGLDIDDAPLIPDNDINPINALGDNGNNRRPISDDLRDRIYGATGQRIDT